MKTKHFIVFWLREDKFMCTMSVRKYDSFRDRKFKCKDFFFIDLFSSFNFSLLGI